MLKAIRKWFKSPVEQDVDQPLPKVDVGDISTSLITVSDTAFWIVSVRGGLNRGESDFTKEASKEYIIQHLRARELNEKEGRFDYIKEITKLIGEAKNHLNKTDGDVYGLCSYIKSIVIDRKQVLPFSLLDKITSTHTEGEMMIQLEKELVWQINNRNTVKRVIEWTTDTALLDFTDINGHHDSTHPITAIQQRIRRLAEIKLKV